MKVVITGGGEVRDSGHTLGKWLIDCFKDHDLVQLSRTTGYDFYKNYDEIVDIARTADLYINASCVDEYQIRLVEDVYGYVPNMLVIGSISGDFVDAMGATPGSYPYIKNKLKKKCRMIALEKKSDATNILHLTVTEVEDPIDNKDGLTKNQLKEIIDFWLKNPIIENIDFKFFIGEHFLSEEKMSKVNRVLEYYRND